MSVAGIIVSRAGGPPSPSMKRSGTPADVRVARAAAEAPLDELVVVLGDESRAGQFPTSATILLDESGSGDASALRSAIDWCQREGHEAVVVAITHAGSALDAAAWTTLARSGRGPIAVLAGAGDTPTLVRVAAEAWPVIPLDGALGQVVTTRPELVAEVAPPAGLEARVADGHAEPVSDDEVATVTRLLGRPPQGAFTVAVRAASGEPVVIENAPFLADGTPMPTRYWLIGRREQEAVGRLESSGGVRRAGEAVSPSAIAEAHARYAAARDARISPSHVGPRPYGGVGGTREGVKCLHAHLAWYLAGGADPVGRWVVSQIAGQIDGPVAAIDCGTNSTRLLVVGRRGETLAREMTITRLGAGVDQTGALAPEAIARTLHALETYQGVIDAHGVVAVRAAATSAARDAANADTFFDGAERVLGVRPELLSGEEEGRLSYAGATADLDGEHGPFFVCDLGGGSTELVAGGPDGEPAATLSLDVGCVRVTERFFDSDPPTPDALSRARAHIGELVDGARRSLPGLAAPRVMIGLAGTVSALVTLSLGLDQYDREKLHHAHLSRASVEESLQLLAAIPASERRRRPGIEPGRADVIVGGALVLAVVMESFGHEELIYSESDILDGLAADLRQRVGAAHSR